MTPKGDTMTDTPTAWVVTDGEYSSYHIKVICPTKADAEAIQMRAKAVGQNVEIEEYPMCTAATFTFTPWLSMGCVIEMDGTVTKERQVTRVEWPDHDEPTLQWTYHPKRRDGLGGGLSVWGTDIERVRKVYGERKAMLQIDDAMRAAPRPPETGP